MLRTVWCLETRQQTLVHIYTQWQTGASAECALILQADCFNLVSGESTRWLLEPQCRVFFWSQELNERRFWASEQASEGAGGRCQAWASTCERAVPGRATPCRCCDRSVRVSRYVGQSPGTPSMGTRGEASGLARKWRIIQRARERASDTSTGVTLANVQRRPPPSTLAGNLSNIRS